MQKIFLPKFFSRIFKCPIGNFVELKHFCFKNILYISFLLIVSSYISTLSKGLNPHISTSKLCLHVLKYPLTGTMAGGVFRCVPVPTSAQLRPCHQSRGGEAGAATGLRTPASAALEAGGCWPLDTDPAPATFK